MSSNHGRNESGRAVVAGVGLDPVTEVDVVDLVNDGWRNGSGGVIVTPNVDIWRVARRDPSVMEMLERARVVVADGQPLVWAARLSGSPVPERVTGSSLVESLSHRAAESGRSVFLVGGGTEGAAGVAAQRLSERYPGLRVAGTLAPPFGFEHEPAVLESVVGAVVEAAPDLVLVGLGFPKQEHLAYALAERLESAWFLGCGGGIEMAAGLRSRSPRWAQRIGAEWLVRLIQDPRRLAKRYLWHDIPAAISLLITSAAHGWRTRKARVDE